MANRFDKTYDQQPWVSSYVPLPLKDIELGYKAQQKTYDDAMAAVANEPVIVGGNRTKTVGQGLENEKNNFLKSVVDEAVETKDYSQVKNKIKAYKNQLEANPYYQGILADKALSPGADLTIVGDKDRQVAQDFYDYDKGEYNQITDRPFTAGDYAAMAPPNTQAIFKPYYEQLDKRIIESIDPALKPHLNADGTVTYFQNGKKETKSLSREEVRKLAEPMMKDASFRSLDPFGYNKLRHKQIFGKDILDPNGNVIERGSQWDDYNDPLDIFAANYLGSKYELDRTSSAIYTTKVDDGGGRTSSSNGGGDTPDPGDNIWSRTLDQLNTPTTIQKADGTSESVRGIADADQITVDALVGADTKTHIVDLTGREIILSPVEQFGTTGEKAVEGRKVIKLSNELDAAKKMAEKTSEKQEVQIAYLENKYKLSPDQKIVKEEVSVGTGGSMYAVGTTPTVTEFFIVNKDGSKKLLEDTEDGVLRETKKFMTENDDGVKMAKLNAIKAGYNLDSPEAKKIIENEQKKSPQELLLNKALEAGMLNGEYEFMAAKDKRNVFTDKAMNAYGSGYIKMNSSQLNKIPGLDSEAGFDIFNLIDKGWKTLVKTESNPNGVILEASDEKGETYYKVPVSVQSVEDVSTLVSNVQLGKYGGDPKTQDQIPGMQAEAKDKQNYMKGIAQEQNILNALNKGTIKSYTDIGIDKYKDNEIVSSSLKIIDEMPDGEKKNKEIADLWLMIDNYSAWSKKWDKGPDPFKVSTDGSGNKFYYYNNKPISKEVYDANVPKEVGKPKAGQRK